MINIWIDFVKWITTLTQKKLIVVLVSILTSLLCYSRWELRNENTRLVSRIANIRHANDSILSIYRLQVSECEKTKADILEESNNYWRAKFDTMEKRMQDQYKEIKKVKSNIDK